MKERWDRVVIATESEPSGLSSLNDDEAAIATAARVFPDAADAVLVPDDDAVRVFPRRENSEAEVCSIADFPASLMEEQSNGWRRCCDLPGKASNAKRADVVARMVRGTDTIELIDRHHGRKLAKRHGSAMRVVRELLDLRASRSLFRDRRDLTLTLATSGRPDDASPS